MREISTRGKRPLPLHGTHVPSISIHGPTGFLFFHSSAFIYPTEPVSICAFRRVRICKTERDTRRGRTEQMCE